MTLTTAFLVANVILWTAVLVGQIIAHRNQRRHLDRIDRAHRDALEALESISRRSHPSTQQKGTL